MAGFDMMLQSAMNLLVSRIPQEHIDKLASLGQIAIDLDAKLTRVEMGQQELRTLLIALIETMQQQKGITNERRTSGERSDFDPGTD
jgi:hypothetical protein